MWLKRTFLLILLLALSAPAHAEEIDPYAALKKHASYLSISHENDNLGGGTDRYYTSGSRATWFNTKMHVPPVIDTLADKIPTFRLDQNVATSYTIGQNLYTPADIKTQEPQPNDRPWAGFLYGSVGLANITYNEDRPFHVDELEFTLGIIGPEALGKQTQRFIHQHISNSPDPRGWKNQLNFEPGFIISWQRRIPYAISHDFAGLNARIEPNISASLGTIRSNLGAGASFVLSSGKEQDTPQRVRPAIPGTGIFFTEKHKLNWQVFAGLDARIVGRDIFLDGNTFTDSPSVDKRYFVGDASAGLSITYDDYRLSYTVNARSKEFKDQDKSAIFGSLTLTKRF